MAKKEWTPPSLADFKYVTAEEAARRLGMSIGTLYRHLSLPRGDWHKVDGRWRVNVEALDRRLAEDEQWREKHRATHVAVPAEPCVPVETRPEPDWAAMPRCIGVQEVSDILGLVKHRICVMGAKGVLLRTEKPGLVPTGRTSGKGARMVRRRWLYDRESVRRYWQLQEGAAYRRALRGDSFRDWGPRNSADVPACWRDMVDTATAAEMLCVGTRHVAHLCRTGKLPAYQDRPGHAGSRLRIPRAAVMRYAMRAERTYWRAIHEIAPEAPEPGEERLRKSVQFERDAERRRAAHRKRLEIAEGYGYDSAEMSRIREGEDEPEEGKTVEVGFGYLEWTPADNGYVTVECWPLRREFGEREIDHGDFYSSAQVARLLGVAKHTVRGLRQSGRLQGYRVKEHRSAQGRGSWWWFYRKEDVEVLQAELQRKRREKRAARGE